MILELFSCAFLDGCELRVESAINCHQLHPAQYEVGCNVLRPVSSECCVIFMACGGGVKGRSAFAHVKSRQHKAHRLTLQKTSSTGS